MHFVSVSTIVPVVGFLVEYFSDQELAFMHGYLRNLHGDYSAGFAFVPYSPPTGYDSRNKDRSPTRLQRLERLSVFADRDRITRGFFRNQCHFFYSLELFDGPAAAV